MSDRIIRPSGIKAKTGISAETVRRLEIKGLFPRRRSLSGSRVGWLESEVDAWIASRPQVVLEGEGGRSAAERSAEAHS